MQAFRMKIFLQENDELREARAAAQADAFEWSSRI